jgi:hypothetical protein
MVERKEKAAGLTKPRRTRNHRRVAAATPDLPEEIVVWEILVRLPAKDILRCRAVCRSWRRLTSAADFILAHHRAQPFLPLFTLSSEATPSFERGRPVLGFEDNEDFRLLASNEDMF